MQLWKKNNCSDGIELCDMIASQCNIDVHGSYSRLFSSNEYISCPCDCVSIIFTAMKKNLIISKMVVFSNVDRNSLDNKVVLYFMDQMC